MPARTAGQGRTLSLQGRDDGLVIVLPASGPGSVDCPRRHTNHETHIPSRRSTTACEPGSNVVDELLRVATRGQIEQLEIDVEGRRSEREGPLGPRIELHEWR